MSERLHLCVYKYAINPVVVSEEMNVGSIFALRNVIFSGLFVAAVQVSTTTRHRTCRPSIFSVSNTLSLAAIGRTFRTTFCLGG